MSVQLTSWPGDASSASSPVESLGVVLSVDGGDAITLDVADVLASVGEVGPVVAPPPSHAARATAAPRTSADPL